VIMILFLLSNFVLRKEIKQTYNLQTQSGSSGLNESRASRYRVILVDADQVSLYSSADKFYLYPGVHLMISSITQTKNHP
jgi:hypothetical protein